MPEQDSLFDLDDYTEWRKEWRDMPEFSFEDVTPFRQIIISFECWDDVKEFQKLVNQTITPNTKSLWFPKRNREKPSNFVYIGTGKKEMYVNES